MKNESYCKLLGTLLLDALLLITMKFNIKLDFLYEDVPVSR